MTQTLELNQYKTVGELEAEGLTVITAAEVSEGDLLDLRGDIIADPDFADEDYAQRYARVELVANSPEGWPVLVHIQGRNDPAGLPAFPPAHRLIKVG